MNTALIAIVSIGTLALLIGARRPSQPPHIIYVQPEASPRGMPGCLVLMVIGFLMFVVLVGLAN